jgi:hypothetical protein
LPHGRGGTTGDKPAWQQRVGCFGKERMGEDARQREPSRFNRSRRWWWFVGDKDTEAALRIGFYRPIRCRQIFLFCGNGLKGTPELRYEDPEVTHTTVFELCSWQPPDCETVATVLRVLLRAAKQGDAWPRTASYVVVYLSCSIYGCFEGSSSEGSFGETECWKFGWSAASRCWYPKVTINEDLHWS